MAYPQPDPNQYVLNGQEFFRLNTLLLSDGDIYESPQGSYGLAIGPDSDISKVNVAYFDAAQERFMNQVSISPSRPFPGRIPAANDSKYAPSARPGRLLFWPDEIYNEDYRPSDFDPGGCRLDAYTPVLDVVQYYSPLALSNGQRNDKEYYFQRLPWQTARYYILIPYYGRRYANVIISNETDAEMTVAGFGVTYKLKGNSGLTGVEVPVIASTVYSIFEENQFEIKASTDGMFDAIYLKFESASAPALPSGESPVKIRVSDTER